MQIKNGFVLREVCGERVIVGEGLGAVDFGRMLCLNETSAWIWNKAVEAGDFTVDMLARALSEEYDVTLDTAQADVAETVDKWRELGVVE